jgi:hypothetical protein
MILVLETVLRRYLPSLGRLNQMRPADYPYYKILAMNSEYFTRSV